MKKTFIVSVIGIVLIGFVSFIFLLNTGSQQPASIVASNSTTEVTPSVAENNTPHTLSFATLSTPNQNIDTPPVSTQQAKAKKYENIKAMHSNIPKEYKRSVLAFDRQIEINAPIFVPDASSLPILTFYGELDNQNAEPSFKSISLKKGMGKLDTSKRHMFCEDGIAEAVPTPPDQVFPSIEALLINHESVRIVPKGQVAYSRGYAAAYPPGDALPIELTKTEYAYVDTGRPITDAGFYQVSAMQKVEEITLFDNFYFIIQYQSDPQLPSPYIKAYYYDDANYDISGVIINSYDMKIQDVPVLSFDHIESVIDYYITAGLLRDLFDITFGYMILCTDDDNIYVTIPVWQIRGDIFLDPYSEYESWFKSWTGEHYYNRQIGGNSIRINAQTGEVIDRLSDDIRRYYANPILTWGDVQGYVQ